MNIYLVMRVTCAGDYGEWQAPERAFQSEDDADTYAAKRSQEDRGTRYSKPRFDVVEIPYVESTHA